VTAVRQARRPRPEPSVAEQVLGLIDLLYRAATTGSSWNSFLERLGSITGSEVVPFLVWDYGRRDGQCLRVFPLDAVLIAEYQSWAPKNAYVRPEPRLESGQVRVIPATAAFVRDSEFLNEWLRPRVGVGHNLASCVASTDSYSIHLSPLRDSRRAEYGSDEVQLMRALVPHVMRAVTIEQRLGGVTLGHAGASEALDRIPTAVLLLDERGRVTVLNRAADDLLRRGDGLTLQRDRQLRATLSADAVALRRAIVGACATGAARADDGGAPWHAGSALLIARPLKRPLQITVSPVRLAMPILAGAPPRAMVLIADPDERPAGSADTWRRLFGFTAAETRVAALLATGLRVQDCADALSVGAATIRTHLKRLLHKTGSRTQSDLMRALLVGPPLGDARDPDEVETHLTADDA
jgi:DNA-binding CsgD family transcriptional regulator